MKIKHMLAPVILLISFLLTSCSATKLTEFKDALADGNINQMLVLYEDAADNDELVNDFDETVNSFLEEVSEALNSYEFADDGTQDGQTLVDAYLQAQWNGLISRDGLDSLVAIIDEDTTENWDKLWLLIDSKVAYCSGIYNVQSVGDCKTAIEYFVLVEEGDSYYENAQQYINDNIEALIADTLSSVQSYMESGGVSVSSGIEQLNDLQSYLESTDLYSGDIKTEVDDARHSCAEIYASQARSSFEEYDFETAIEYMEVASKIELENTEYEQLKSEYEQYLPYYLTSKNSIVSVEINELEGEIMNTRLGQYTLEEEEISRENVTVSNVIKVDSFLSTWFNYPELIMTFTFSLSGNYDYVHGCQFYAQDAGEHEQCYFKAYGDGNLLFTSDTLTSESTMLDYPFDFGVQGVDVLKIEVYGGGTEETATGINSYCLGDMYAQKMP